MRNFAISGLKVALPPCVALGVFACVLAAAPAAGAEPKDVIKKFKTQAERIEYKDGERADPFEPLFPFRTKKSRDQMKVRIQSLKLSSVMSGRRKVAILKEVHGPASYILVDNVLLGADRKPIPGIAGIIEPLNEHGEFRVTLKQGGDEIVFTLENKDLDDMRAARARARGAAGDTRR